jgi:hypothetical protein
MGCRTAAWLICLMCGLLVAGVALSRSFRGVGLAWGVFASGGGHTGSANYGLDSTLGQWAIGAAGSPNYRLGIGFWYGVGGAGQIATPTLSPTSTLTRAPGVTSTPRLTPTLTKTPTANLVPTPTAVTALEFVVYLPALIR